MKEMKQTTGSDWRDDDDAPPPPPKLLPYRALLGTPGLWFSNSILSDNS